jgi:hypothetical protein
MKNDPIVEEVHRTKEKLAAKFNYDIDAIFADAMRRQSRSRTKPSPADGPRAKSKAAK